MCIAPWFPPLQVIDPEHFQQIMAQHQLRYVEMARDRDTQVPRSVDADELTASQNDKLNPYIGYSGRFMLNEQPNVRQRKSYKNENRYYLVRCVL